MKKKIKLASLFTALIFLFELFSPVFYEMVQAELYMSVSGKVVDKETNLTVENAKVMIFKVSDGDDEGGNIEKFIESISTKKSFDFAKTDNRGIYSFDLVPPGKYSLFVQPPNASDYAFELIPREVKVSRAKNVINQDFKLQKGYTVSGRVRGVDSITPVANAQVLAYSENSFALGKTDNKGFYKLTNLKIDISYSIIVMPKSHAVILKNGIRNSSLQGLENVDFVLSKNDSAKVSGTIVDKLTSLPIKGAFVILANLEKGGVGETSSDGVFSISNLTEGEYTTQVRAIGYKSFETKITITRDMEKHVEFELDQLSHQQGRLSSPIKQILALIQINRQFSLMHGFSGAAYAQDICLVCVACAQNEDVFRGCVALAIACLLFGLRFGGIPGAAGGAVVCYYGCRLFWVWYCPP